MTTDDCLRIDPATVAALHAAHSQELRSFLIGVLRDGDLADEILQATFGKLIELGHTAREESQKGWLFSVALNEALMLRRRLATEQRALTRLAGWRKRENESPSHSLDRRDELAKVQRALERLTPDQRLVVHKKIYEEKTFVVIAGELKIPLGTVLTRMRAAIINLRRDLKSRE